MGANQSSKSAAVGGRSDLKSASGGGGGGQSHKLSASLRKSVNSVLNSSSSRKKRASADDTSKQSPMATADGSGVRRHQQHQHQQASDPYYASLARGKSFAGTTTITSGAAMNNYVTMQQQQPTRSSAAGRANHPSAGLQTITTLGQNCGNGGGNKIQQQAPNELYGARFYADPMEINSSSQALATSNNAAGSGGASVATTTIATSSATTPSGKHELLNSSSNSSRSQTYMTPFHLSRANIKQSNVLNINSGRAAASGSLGSSAQSSQTSVPGFANIQPQQQLQYQHQLITNNKAIPAVQNRQAPATTTYQAYRSTGQLYPLAPDPYSQVVYFSHEDIENRHYYHPQARPPNHQQQEQYQYHNNNNNHSKSHSKHVVSATQPSAILDFHLDCNTYNSSRALPARTLERESSKLASMFKKQHSNTIHLAHQRPPPSTISSSRHTNSSSNNNSRSNNSISKSSSSLKRIKSTQQASYEAMRFPIDLYIIKNLAGSCHDFEMEQKIDLEIRLRELAAQSMLEARTEIDALEVEKSLLTSDQRMNCYAAQLEQQRKQLSNPSLSTDSGRGSKTGAGATGRQHRGDVIGQPAATAGAATAATTGGAGSHTDTSSPSFSSLSNSQSPSKLSPVSGESANSPPSFTSSHHSRGTGYRNRHSSSSNTLNSRQRAKNKKREQLMQSITSLSNINCNMVTNSRASVSISELRIPLMWRDVDHFKGRGDYKRFAVFCLLKIDSQIYDTQLISDVDRDVTDVTFDDVVVFNEIDHNFELTLEVYSCVYLEQFSLSSTPRKLKEKLTSSVSRAMGRRLASQTASVNYTRELQAYDKSYRFAMIASATLRLDEASDSVKTYDLVVVSPKDANKNTLPLFGHFCAKLLVKPNVFERATKAGYLRVATIAAAVHNDNINNNNDNNIGHSPSRNGVGLATADSAEAASLRQALAASTKMAALSMSCSSVYWGLLRNFALHLWPVDERTLDYKAVLRGDPPHLDSQSVRRPQITLNVDKYARLLRVSNSSLTIETADKSCFVLAAYCSNEADEISQWLRSIEQHIYDSHIWGSLLNHYPPRENK